MFRSKESDLEEVIEKFRSEVRGWLDENCPETMRTKGTEDDWVWGGKAASFPHPDAKTWMDDMLSLIHI